MYIQDDIQNLLKSLQAIWEEENSKKQSYAKGKADAFKLVMLWIKRDVLHENVSYYDFFTQKPE